MEETIRLWIRDLGFPVTVAGLAIYALYKMFMLREQMAATHIQALNKHSTELKSMSEKMGLALTENTGATKVLSAQMKEGCLAQPCEARELLRKLGHHVDL